MMLVVKSPDSRMHGVQATASAKFVAAATPVQDAVRV